MPENPKHPEKKLSDHEQLFQSLNHIVQEIEPYLKPNSESKLIIGGSFGRRLAVADFVASIKSSDSEYQGLSLNEYLQHTTDSYNLPPRRTDSGRYDLDLAVEDTVLPWQDLNNIAAQITQTYPDIEVDPHFINTFETDEGKFFRSKNDPNGVVIPFETIPIKITEERKIYVMSLRTQFFYLSKYSHLAHKNFSEVLWLNKVLTKKNEESNESDQLVKTAREAFIRRFLQKKIYKQIAKAMLGIVKPEEPRTEFNFQTNEARYF